MDVLDEEAAIVLERIRAMPRTIKLNIGSQGSFSRDELIKAISNKTEVGALVVKMHMQYLRSFRTRASL